MVATVAKVAINVVRSADDVTNRLPEILLAWFGNDAGLPGRSNRVRLRLRDNTWLMEPMGAVGRKEKGSSFGSVTPAKPSPQPSGSPSTKLPGTQASCSSLPSFSPRYTEERGHAGRAPVCGPFISANEFSWQSQNRTTQASKHGRLIRDHKEMGLHVHLLVRKTKKMASKPAPFIYCGEVDFESWVGEFADHGYLASSGAGPADTAGSVCA